MKMIRVAYLAFVMVVACAHMFVAVSPWTALPFVAGGSGPVGMAWFVATLMLRPDHQAAAGAADEDLDGASSVDIAAA